MAAAYKCDFCLQIFVGYRVDRIIVGSSMKWERVGFTIGDICPACFLKEAGQYLGVDK